MIVVVGSLNLDLVARVPRRPEQGETLFGHGLEEHPGGKGGNQAVAAAKLGVPTSFVGALGQDGFGDTILSSLHANKIDTQAVTRLEGVASGVAIITVDDNAENSIIVLSGANMEVTPEQVEAAEEQIKQAKVMLLQLEIPMAATIKAAELGRKHGLTVILDPAPAPQEPLPQALLQNVDYLVPNESEAKLITGLEVDPANPKPVAEALLKLGVGHALITLGANGVYLLGPEGELRQPRFEVKAVDTTAAGDAFAGGFGAALAQGLGLQEALRWGAAAGALAVTRVGAQPAMADKAELLAFLENH